MYILKKIKSVFYFYYEGFRDMSSMGKKLWLIIFVKVIIMFAVLKVFFFPNYLNERCETVEQKQDTVIENLVQFIQK